MRVILSKKNRGAALLTVLIILTTLSAIIISSITLVHYKMTDQLVDMEEMEATALAHRGLSIGVNPLIKSNDPHLDYVSGDGRQSYTVLLSSEDKRININEVLKRGDKNLLRQLFTSWGVDFDQASAVVDALVDWVDVNDVVELNGAETQYYEELGYVGRPYNIPFSEVADMSLVKDFAVVESLRPDWDHFFTIQGDAKLDIHAIDVELLAVAAEVDEFRAEGFVMEVRGEDEAANTEDDHIFSSLGAALDALGVGEESSERGRIMARFRLRGNTKRIESIGISGNVRKKILAIIQRSGNRITILEQKEFTQIN